MKQCRNAAYLSTYDASGASNLPLSRAAAGVNTGAGIETLTFTSNHGLVNDFPIIITNATPANVPGGLTNGTTYYAKVFSATAIQFAATPGGAAINLTSAGTGTHIVSAAPDSTAGVWDTIDDSNNNLAVSPDASPWHASYICNETNFSDGSNTTTLVPSGVTPTDGSSTWDQIWRDDLTGLYFTNILYDGQGTPATDWSKAMTVCSGLDSGDGAGKWRLPTQKELMQLYINGIAKIAITGGAFDFFWSSSSGSDVPDFVWTVDLGKGLTYLSYTRTLTFARVLCVR